MVIYQLCHCKRDNERNLNSCIERRNTKEIARCSCNRICDASIDHAVQFFRYNYYYICVAATERIKQVSRTDMCDMADEETLV